MSPEIHGTKYLPFLSKTLADGHSKLSRCLEALETFLKDLEMKSVEGIPTAQQPCCAGVNSLAPTVSSIPRIHRICSWL